jgi:hypothetical protein
MVLRADADYGFRQKCRGHPVPLENMMPTVCRSAAFGTLAFNVSRHGDLLNQLVAIILCRHHAPSFFDANG